MLRLVPNLEKNDGLKRMIMIILEMQKALQVLAAFCLPYLSNLFFIGWVLFFKIFR
jgi:hypothetical protein